MTHERSPGSHVYPALAALNNLSEYGFRAWYFRPGMLFGEANNWWGRQAKRPTVHEGLDFRYFIDCRGQVAELAHGALIPAVRDGVVRQILADFLGQSILTAHDLYCGARRLYSIHAHLLVDTKIDCGDYIHAGQLIGTIAAGSRQVPAHLHISYLWLPRHFGGTFAWQTASEDRDVCFTNPLCLLDLPSVETQAGKCLPQSEALLGGVEGNSPLVV